MLPGDKRERKTYNAVFLLLFCFSPLFCLHYRIPSLSKIYLIKCHLITYGILIAVHREWDALPVTMSIVAKVTL